MIGILAYGSLIAHPGHEIESVLDHVIPDVETPFPVEYVRCSKSRAGAPTLVPVPIGRGSPVRAAVLVLREGTTHQQAMDMLYRRELHQEGNPKINYADKKQRSKEDAVVIEHLANFQGVLDVYITILKPNFTEILDANRTQEDKVKLLTRAAIESVTRETYAKGMDGIEYLADNIDAGVVTTLTRIYCQAVLDIAGNAQDLRQARSTIAQNKGVTL